MNTKKSLGQHWLKDSSVLESICDDAEVTKDDHVLEIGPGLGTLTERLLARGASVTAVEFDSDLLDRLDSKFSANGKFSLINADILKFDYSILPAGYKVVANIPYYLTSKLLRNLCEADNNFSLASVLVQREVAERVCAKPGTMGILSASVQYYCHVGLGTIVPAELFTPPPKVDSRVLKLSYRDEPLFTDVDADKFFRLVKAGFSERRKKLRSSISGSLDRNKLEVDDLLNRAGISKNARAQELSLDDWHKLYLQL